MVELIVLALIIAVVVGLLLSGLLGPILTVGAFFTQYGWAIGVLAGQLWYFFTSGGFGKL